MSRMTRATAARLGALAARRPVDSVTLRAWVKVVLGLDVPGEPVMAGSCAPLEYLSHVFFERGGDVVVWAPRGGGKTMLGAVATVLDLFFKPGVQVRILGGSLEQSSRMYEYVLALLDRPVLRGLLSQEPTQRRVVTHLGSRAAVLAQSQRSVRGVRVQKLRCDEVEEFDPAVWEAAQLVTRSGRCGGQWVNGTVEALSTMHRPGGLMGRLVESAGPEVGVGGSASGRVFRWTALDVVERCPAERGCAGCVLWEDCGGRAKHAAGFVPVADLVSQWARSSRSSWSAEMMCRRPTVRARVFEEFDPLRHVRADDPVDGVARPRVVAGMDFGWRSPTVVVWARVWGEGVDRVVQVVDEYARSGATLAEHLEELGGRPWGEPAWIGVDPAGRAGNGQTGRSDVQVIRSTGRSVRARPRSVREGVELVRAMLDRGRLFFHPRCTGLIAAMEGYHFDPQRPGREEPVKDGPDHWCDALRYLLTNLDGSGAEVVRRDYLYG